jgi:hypothetical protein
VKDNSASEEPREVRKTGIRLILLDRDCPAYDLVNQRDKQSVVLPLVSQGHGTSSEQGDGEESQGTAL